MHFLILAFDKYTPDGVAARVLHHQMKESVSSKQNLTFKVLTTGRTAQITIQSFLPYLSTRYAHTGTLSIAARLGVLASQEISIVDRAEPVGDWSDRSTLATLAGQPICNP